MCFDLVCLPVQFLILVLEDGNFGFEFVIFRCEIAQLHLQFLNLCQCNFYVFT